MLEAVAFDLDDTLLRDDRTISPLTISTLRRAADQGIRILPASGRSAASMAGYVDQIGCASAYVACNGAEIMGADHITLHQSFLPVELSHRVARFAENHQVYAQCYAGDHFFYSRQGKEAEAYALSSSLKGTYVGDLTAFIKSPTPKMLLQADPEVIRGLREEAEALFGQEAQVTISKPYFLEINPQGTSKGTALAWLADHLGFSLKGTMAFGDSHNDLSMLTMAGYGVAMGNAAPEIQSQVKHVCLSNQEDGVARYLADHLSP